MADPAFDELKKKVLSDTGFDLNNYTQEYVKRRIGAWASNLNLKDNDWAAYATVLEKNSAAYVKLFDFFSVNVTEFCRDISLWKTLVTTTFPLVFEEKKISKVNSLRIWSAGCSTGEEPYSIAIAVKEMLPKGFSFFLLATDIDDDAIAKAQAGLYGSETLRNIEHIEPSWLPKYFTLEKDHAGRQRIRITDEIKRMVSFKKHDFMREPAPAYVDMVFCRNAIIYISKEAKETLLETFYNSLTNHGFLVVGKSEVIFPGKDRHCFYPQDTAEHIYRKERRFSRS
jgi:chemotaxis protein methyltransferase CheR